MAANPYLEAALNYLQRGFSVIPIIPGEKRPLIKWEEFQKRRASRNELVSWWSNAPNANVGIVTGTISGVDVVDIDNDQGRELILEYIPDSFVAPTVKTPRGGEHLYGQHVPGVTNKAGAIPGTDFRGEGGYVVAPPSVNGTGKAYVWIVPLDASLPSLPEQYINKINSTLYRGDYKGGGEKALHGVTSVTERYIWEHGVRDENLFHVAACLARTGNSDEYIRQTLTAIMSSWGEHDEKWIDAKVQSALTRKLKRERNFQAEVEEWIRVTERVISVTECYYALQCVTKEEKTAVRVAFHRLKNEGFIDKHGEKGGVYRLKDQDAAPIDILQVDMTPYDITLPLGVHEYVTIHKGNLIIIAGESNAGKTAFCLNIAKANRKKHRVNYLSSEMQDGTELRIRLDEFADSIEAWREVNFRFRTDNFPDVIEPDNLNIIDYLDEGADKEAYKMTARIKEIGNKLKKGIAIIAIQKHSEKSWGFGGEGTMNKARLYMTITRHGVLKIEKGKIWRQKFVNPSGMFINFKLAAGCKFSGDSGWQRPG